MAVCVVRACWRENSISRLRFANAFFKKSTASKLKSICSPIITSFSRHFCSENPRNDAQKSHKKIEKVSYSETWPVQWLFKKARILFTKAILYDSEYDEDEFIRGAKQALVVTSEIIANGRFNELSKFFEPNANIDAITKKNFGREVNADDILMAQVKEIRPSVTEDEVKEVVIDVSFFIRDPNLNLRKTEKQETLNQNNQVFEPRIIHYSFRRECFGNDDWTIVGIDILDSKSSS